MARTEQSEQPRLPGEIDDDKVADRPVECRIPCDSQVLPSADAGVVSCRALDPA
jgi:hypothetical protein